MGLAITLLALLTAFREPISTEIVPAEPDDIDVLFEITVTLSPAAGAASRWRLHSPGLRRGVGPRACGLRSTAGRQAVGGYFLQSKFPAFAAHIAQGGYLVARACRGSGIGTELLDHSLREAHRLGYTTTM